MKIVLLFLVIVVAALLGAVILKPAAEEKGAARASDAKAGNAARDLPASSVLRINPRSSPTATLTSPVTAAPVVTPNIAQLRSRKGWADLYGRVSSGAQTPEALYIQAEIYSRCAKRQPSAAASSNPAEARDKFIASVKGDPSGEQRIAAYDKANADPCEGLTLGDRSKERLAQMVAAAAGAGDPHAQAWQLAQSIERPFFDAQAKPIDGQPRPNGYAVSDEQMETIRRLLASGDPDVLVEFQGILSSSLIDANLRMGPDNARVDGAAMSAALTLVACDLGMQCGPDSQRLALQCALQGYCAANNLYDYTYFYESAPYQAQLMEQYRQALLQMANARDFSGLRVVREPGTPGMTYIRGGRRGGP